MKLYLKAIEVECVIGDLPEERNAPQRILVDVALEVSDKAARSDVLSDTADYAAVVRAVREALAEAKCRLIERAALVAAEAALEAAPQATAAAASATKSGSVLHLGSATATVEVAR